MYTSHSNYIHHQRSFYHTLHIFLFDQIETFLTKAVLVEFWKMYYSRLRYQKYTDKMILTLDMWFHDFNNT